MARVSTRILTAPKRSGADLEKAERVNSSEECAERDAGPNDEERGQPHVPLRTSLARSSSSVSVGFGVRRLEVKFDVELAERFCLIADHAEYADSLRVFCVVRGYRSGYRRAARPHGE
jgi:hypothetical protein